MYTSVQKVGLRIQKGDQLTPNTPRTNVQPQKSLNRIASIQPQTTVLPQKTTEDSMASTGSAAGGCAQWPATTTTRTKKNEKKSYVQGLRGLPSEDADFRSDQHSDLGQRSSCAVVPIPALGNHNPWMTRTWTLGGVPILDIFLLIPGYPISGHRDVRTQTCTEQLLHIVHP